MSGPIFRKKGAGQPEVPIAVSSVPHKAGKSEGRQGIGTVQVNCHLPEGLHKRLRVESVRRGQTLAETLAVLVREHTSEM